MQKRIFNLLVWFTALLLLVWTLQQVPWGAVLQVLQHLTFGNVFVLIGLNLTILLSLTARWQVFLRSQHVKLPLFQLLSYRLSAFSVSYFTPGPQFGGEPVQVWSLHRCGVATTTGTTSVVLDKLLELLINFTVLSIGAVAILALGLWPLSNLPILSVLVFFLLALPIFYMSALWRGKQPLRSLFGYWTHDDREGWLVRGMSILVESEHQAGLVCQKQPRILISGLLWSMIAWALMLLEFGLSAHFLGIDLTTLQMLAVLALARFAFLTPMPAGLGILESSQVIAITALGYDAGAAIALVILIRTRDLIIGGIGLLLLGRLITPVRYASQDVQLVSDVD
jgi:uncharacterized protein (TIRG00374 family)